MKRTFSRTERLADQIQRSLAQILQRDVKDPRLGLVTISAVELSRDLQHAKVYVTFMVGSAEQADQQNDYQEQIDTLTNIAGFLRSQLAPTIHTRHVPALHFIYDQSISRGRDLSSLIAQARQRDDELNNDVE